MDRNFDSTSSPNDPVKPGGCNSQKDGAGRCHFRPGRRSESGPTFHSQATLGSAGDESSSTALAGQPRDFVPESAT